MTVRELVNRLIEADIVPVGSVYTARSYDGGRAESVYLLLDDGRYAEWYCTGGLDHGDASFEDLAASIREFVADRVLH